jgi:cytochrome b
MTRIKVWDVPTRLFHWLLAGTFLTAFGIAQFVPDKDPLFSVHALLGLVIGLMALLRIFWGFAGSRYARFSSFIYGPGDFTGYMKNAFRGKEKRYTGHNPGAGYAVLTMLILLPAIIATGLLGQNGNEIFEGLHEFFAYAMLTVVALHLLGVVRHTIRHKENITVSMVTGTKEGGQGDGILSARPLAGIAFLFLTGFWAAGLFSSYDMNTRRTTLPVIGAAIQLGENEDEAKEHKGRNHDHHEDDDD